MTFKDHFSRDSAAYRENRPSYDINLVDILAAPVKGRDLAVDVGCGNGQFSRLLARRFDHVIAADGSASQIAESEARPNIDYRVATAETLDLKPECADLITVVQAAHWFDRDTFYKVADKALKPGGALALVGYGLTRISPEIDAAIDDFYDRGIGKYWPPERAHMDNAYADFDFPYPEITVDAYTMSVEWSFEQLRGYLNTWSAVGRAQKVLGFNPLDAFAAKLQEVWGGARTRTIRWPMFMRYGLKP
ncbi:class I SAM-dependent methyltransferase [Kordiimonas aestuarii]|uniref:class I SAM-dependent methyltransferase n=1 Tax=Kordiimonas aestuarii TaxID=1005925 RepID=UPI0021D0A3ED|nr:class I SAM-dependent methyltransferase [Kordiimonas aestuarii]